MENNIPNLDAMLSDELMAFWTRHQGGQAYRALFPNGGPGSKLMTAKLANYASNKATAISCRIGGHMDRAKIYEDIADRIYKELPADARW